MFSINSKKKNIIILLLLISIKQMLKIEKGISKSVLQLYNLPSGNNMLIKHIPMAITNITGTCTKQRKGFLNIFYKIHVMSSNIHVKFSYKKQHIYTVHVFYSKGKFVLCHKLTYAHLFHLEMYYHQCHNIWICCIFLKFTKMSCTGTFFFSKYISLKI